MAGRQEYLESVAQQCIDDLEYLNIPYGHIYDFSINTRARKRWGQCKRTQNGFTININERLLDGKHEEGLRNTIYHELLHTCPKSFNHGTKWKHYASIVRERLGYNIKRCDSEEEKGFNKTPPTEARYIMECSKCGVKIGRERRGKFVNNPQSYIHSGCGGYFKRVK